MTRRVVITGLGTEDQVVAATGTYATNFGISGSDENATIIVLGSHYSKLVYRSKDLISLFNSSQVPDEEE